MTVGSSFKAFLILMAFWSLLLSAFLELIERPLEWSLPVALGLTLMQWFLSGKTLQSMYLIEWGSNEVFDGLFEEGEIRPKFGVVKTLEPWSMSYLLAPKDARVVVTAGLLDLFAGDEAGLKAVLSEEKSLASQPDLRAATVMGTAIVMCGLTEEFFLGAGRDIAFQRGMGGGVFLGFLARIFGRGFSWMAAVSVGDRRWRSGHTEELSRALLKIACRLGAPTPTTEVALHRGYASRVRFFAPVDAEEAGRFALDPKGVMGLQPFPLLPVWTIVPWGLGFLGAGLASVLHQPFGLAFIGLGVGWLLALDIRHPRGKSHPLKGVGDFTRVDREGLLYPVVSPHRPWFPAFLLRSEDEWLPIRWRALAGPFEPLLPPPPLESLVGTRVKVRGWLRWEREKYIEAIHIKSPDKVLRNWTLLVHYALAILLIVTGLVINLGYMLR